MLQNWDSNSGLSNSRNHSVIDLLYVTLHYIILSIVSEITIIMVVTSLVQNDMLSNSHECEKYIKDFGKMYRLSGRKIKERMMETKGNDSTFGQKSRCTWPQTVPFK